MNVSAQHLKLEHHLGTSLSVVPKRQPTPVSSLFRHRKLAAAATALVLVLGFVTAMVLGHPQYVAESTVRVSPAVPASMLGAESRFNSDVQYRDYVQQQVFEISNDATAAAALDQLGQDRSLWQATGETDHHAAERLIWNLKVEAVPDSYLIKVSLAGSKPDGLAEIVNAVVKAYLLRQAKQELNGTDLGLQLLATRQTEIQQRMAQNQQQLGGLTQELGVSSLDGALVNPYQKRLSDENDAMAVAQRNVLIAQAHLSALEAHRQRTEDAQVEAKAQDMAAKSSETTTARQQLIQQRETALVELNGLGPNHPGRMALQKQIESVNKELANLDESALDRARTMVRDSEKASTSVDISEAKSNLEQAQLAAEGIQKELDKLQETASSFAAKFSLAVTLHDKLEQDRKSLQETEDRMSMLRLESQSPGVIALESAAITPDTPQKSKRRIIFFLFAVMAMVAGVGLPTFLDLTDPKIKTSAEFEAILGFPPLGVALGSSGGADEETVRRIALGILRERRTSGIRSFVFTSVNEGRNTRLVSALSVELTELGVRTVALEANLSETGARYLGTTASVQAVTTSGRSTSRLFDRQHTESLQQPLVQTGGGSLERRNGKGAQTFVHMHEVVNRALAKHDVVLLDAPPVLASADAIALVQLPAGAILVVHAGSDDRFNITAAVRELEKSAPPVVGAIFWDRGPASSDEYEVDLDIANDHPAALPSEVSSTWMGKLASHPG